MFRRPRPTLEAAMASWRKLPLVSFAAAALFWTAAPATAQTVPGEARFMNFVAPNGTEDAGEPTFGVNETTEQVFSNSNGPIPNGGTVNYFGGFMPYMLSVVFNDCQSPAAVTWTQKPLLLAATPRVAGDPILYTDRYTGRTLVAQLEGLTPLGSSTDYTDDDGDNFFPTEGSGLPSCVDHQTLGGGPFAPPLAGNNPLYPNAVYYCSQCVSHANCSLSLDGGITFLPAVTAFTAVDCHGLHGHIKVGPDGTAFIPNKGCGGVVPLVTGGEAAVVVSEDNGITWDIRTIPNESTPGDRDPSVAVASDANTIYLGYQGVSMEPKIARSTNKGLDWTNVTDLSTTTTPPIYHMKWPAVVAGDPDRAAIAFYGTHTQESPPSPGPSDPGFPGVWYLFVSTTYDGGATWKTVNVTPTDPIQRGGICGSGACRNMLDFFDAEIDKEGRILVAWDDGCIGGCVNGGQNSFTAFATITRQSGGKRMLSAFDPVEPRVAEAPGVTGFFLSGQVDLSWTRPDNGGAVITAYNVYRSLDGGPFNVVATVNETSFLENFGTGDPCYRVTAVNSEGEGPYCGTFCPGTEMPPTPCVLPGILALSDVNGDGSDNDSGQNTPPDPSVNVRLLHIAEPYLGPATEQVTFTLQVVPSTGVLTPSDSQWYIIWNRNNIAGDGSDRRFVSMETDGAGVPSFRYGDFGPGIPVGGVPPTNANTPLILGDADFGSYDAETGVITIKLSSSLLDEGGLSAGDDLVGLNVRTYFNRPDPGQRSQNNASDITGDALYVLAGNASCFVNSPPVARVTADPTSGDAPLLVTFDASASSDDDPGDGVALYRFNFGDGTQPVIQANPIIQHSYDFPSSASGFFVKVTVEDQQGLRSVNVASVNIQVTGSAVAADPSLANLPKVLGLTPLGNPSRGQMFFTLALPQEGRVTIEVFNPAGRRVANLLDASMPAGKHGLHWRGMDDRGKRVAAGVYLVRTQAGTESVTKRVVMVR